MDKMDKAVLKDLITLYQVGEASEETVELIEKWMAEHPEDAGLLSEPGEKPFPDTGLETETRDQDLERLRQVRKIMNLRSWSLVLALVFLFVSVKFEFYLAEKLLLWLRSDPILSGVNFGLFLVFTGLFFWYHRRLRVSNGTVEKSNQTSR